MTGHPFIKSVAIEADLHMVDGAVPKAELIVDRVNFTMSWGDSEEDFVSMTIDGQGESNVKLPRLKLALAAETWLGLVTNLES